MSSNIGTFGGDTRFHVKIEQSIYGTPEETNAKFGVTPEPSDYTVFYVFIVLGTIFAVILILVSVPDINLLSYRKLILFGVFFAVKLKKKYTAIFVFQLLL